VADTVEGFLCAAAAPNAAGGTFNLGSGREISIGDLAKLIGELVGTPVNIATEADRLRPAGSEVERLLADNTKAREVLGWTAKVGLKEGLAKTIEWFRSNQHLYRAGIYTV
jgi:dTDP-glucose 4,6-dehydratase